MKTTVNGKEIQIYGKSTVAGTFTRIVQMYLSCGYVFNYDGNSRGHQGEDMSAYLTPDNGKTAIAIFVKNFTEFDEGMRIDGVHVFTREYKDADKKNVLWMDKGEQISDTRYYKINQHNDKDIFVDNLNDYEAIRKIQRKRTDTEFWLKNLERERDLPHSTYKAALKLVKKQKGHKSARLSDITRVVRRSGHISVYLKNDYLNIGLKQA